MRRGRGCRRDGHSKGGACACAAAGSGPFGGGGSGHCCRWHGWRGSAIAHRVVGGVADSMSGDSSEQAAACAQQQSMSDEYDPCKPEHLSVPMSSGNGGNAGCQFTRGFKQCGPSAVRELKTPQRQKPDDKDRIVCLFTYNLTW